MSSGSIIRALAVDDNPEHRKSFERLKSDSLICTAISPPTPDSLADKILQPIKNGDVDVVLLDFRLDENASPHRDPAPYRGGTPAAAIKEGSPSTPVVLVTSSAYFRDYIENNPHIGSLFDHSLSKSNISKPKDRIAAIATIIDLVRGFRKIQDTANGRSASSILPELLTNTLELQGEELELALDCLGGTSFKSTADVADWILKNILKYPGPLLDENEARVRLGLTGKSFSNSSVQRWLVPSKYSGVFSEIFPRWWEGRLLDQLYESAHAASVDAAGESQERIVAIRHACSDSALTADVCSFCNSGLIQRSCHICQKAVDATHHLAAQVDPRPAWALPAIVCFDCIQKGRDEVAGRRVRYGPGVKPLVEKLRNPRRR